MPNISDLMAFMASQQAIQDAERAREYGTIQQNPATTLQKMWHGYPSHPNLGFKDLLGIEASERIWNRLLNLGTEARPEGADQWAQWAADTGMDTVEMAAAAADLVGAATAAAPAVRSGANAMARNLRQATGGQLFLERMLADEAGVIAPKRTPVSDPLLDIWGKQKPHEYQFEEVNRLPVLKDKLVGKNVRDINVQKGTPMFPGAEEIAAKYGDNPFHRELAASYTQGNVPIEDAERIFYGTMNQDEAGRSAFDNILDLEVRRRADQILAPETKPYSTGPMSISKAAGGNRKVGDAYVDLDTSKGCVGMCPECYACYGGATISKKKFALPQPVRLTGHFSKDPYSIRRIGTSGEPNINPLLAQQHQDEFAARLTSPRRMTEKDLNNYIQKTYDWSYTNDQLKRVGLDTPGTWKGKKYVPGGRDMTFLITKLQSLKNFDPSIIRNLEVSIDPSIPSHFFTALKNVKKLRRMHPEVNVMLRIRSVATRSDEINTLQKMAVDFANRHNLPVLETRVRFKKPDTAALQQLLDEYYFSAGQQKHISYYPSIQSKPGDSIRGGGDVVRQFEAHTETGPQLTEIYMKRPEGTYKGLSRHRKDKAKVWELWDGDQRIAKNLTEEAAQELGWREAGIRYPNIVPSKGTVRRYAIEESPLSQFGLHPNLHRQCNVFNMGAGACGECQGCQMWLEEERARALMPK